MSRKHDKVSVVPSAVVAHIAGEQRLDVSEFFCRVPEGEVPHEPLAVGPDVVVLGV